MADEAENKPHRGLKKGLYVIPTAFTAANVAMGYLAVLSSIRGFQVAVSNPELAASYFNSAGLAIGLAILFEPRSQSRYGLHERCDRRRYQTELPVR